MGRPPLPTKAKKVAHSVYLRPDDLATINRKYGNLTSAMGYLLSTPDTDKALRDALKLIKDAASDALKPAVCGDLKNIE